MKITKKYSQLTQFERDRLEALLLVGTKQKDIAKVLNRNPSTISREIQRERNKKKINGIIDPIYKAQRAGRKAVLRRKNAKFQGKKIENNNKLRKYIINRLKDKWSPDEISGKMKEDKENFYASKDLIYEWLYSSYGQRYCRHLYSRRYTPKKRRAKKTKRKLIPNRIGIKMRPKAVEEKLEFGHCEADTIVSGKKTGSKAALVVNYERKAKLVSIRKMPNMKPNEFNKAMSSIKNAYRELKTLTMDNGIENIYYEQLNIDTYFCDPYSSWQKGGVENINKMIRWFIPKGCDISKFSDDYIKKVENILNNKPRKSLNYKTPLEVAKENNLLKCYA